MSTKPQFKWGSTSAPENAATGLEPSPEVEDLELDPPQELTRPALLAADILLRQLFQNAPPGPKIKASDIVIIKVWDVSWISVVAEVAPWVLLSINTPHGNSAKGRNYRGRNEKYHIFEPTEAVAEYRQHQLCDEIADEILCSKSVIIVTQDHELTVPEPIRRTADHLLILPLFDAASFAVFLQAVTGTLSPNNTDINWNNLHPYMLQLAMRANQTQDEYVKRLEALAYKAPALGLKSSISLKDLHGMPAVSAWAETLAVDIADFKAGRILWNDVDRGALLYGPPGCGKTTAARVIADFCNVPFIATSYSVRQSSGDGHLGDVTRCMRDTFKRAHAIAPAILFIDELDSIGDRQRQSRDRDWWANIINTLLQELDGAVDRDGLVVIGATNYPARIDAAIKRAGRLDREIEIKLPNVAALEKIYSFYIGDTLTSDNLKRLASISDGHSGAEVEHRVRGARRRARTERRSISFADVFLEICGRQADPQDAHVQRIAVHEAGHAMAALHQKPSSVPALALHAKNQLSGAALFDSVLVSAFTSAGVDDLLVLLLAGRAAEEVIFGDPSASAGGSAESDLAHATKLAIQAETSLGLGSTGLLWSGIVTSNQAHAALTLRPATDAAVRTRLNTAYGNAKRLITQNRLVVDAIAKALLSRSVLLPAEIIDLWKSSKLAKDPATFNRIAHESPELNSPKNHRRMN